MGWKGGDDISFYFFFLQITSNQIQRQKNQTTALVEKYWHATLVPTVFDIDDKHKIDFAKIHTIVFMIFHFYFSFIKKQMLL